MIHQMCKEHKRRWCWLQASVRFKAEKTTRHACSKQASKQIRMTEFRLLLDLLDREDDGRRSAVRSMFLPHESQAGVGQIQRRWKGERKREGRKHVHVANAYPHSDSRQTCAAQQLLQSTTKTGTNLEREAEEGHHDSNIWPMHVVPISPLSMRLVYLRKVPLMEHLKP